jgi:hypothetical protein
VATEPPEVKKRLRIPTKAMAKPMGIPISISTNIKRMVNKTSPRYIRPPVSGHEGCQEAKCPRSYGVHQVG